LNPSFDDWSSFQQFFIMLSSSLETWLGQISWWRRTSVPQVNEDTFMEVNRRLVTFITAPGSGIEPSARMPFHCQHILMDFNELVADFPFMKPKVPVVGFGGAFGAHSCCKRKNSTDQIL
jgi:hypothetical protein